jgi:hypothetical protein
VVTLTDERVATLRHRRAEEAAAAATGRVTRARARIDPFPLLAWRRWLLRLVLAFPYLVIGVVGADAGTLMSTTTPNVDHLAALTGLSWSNLDLTRLGEVWPPLGALIVAVVPGGEAGLAVVGALAAGVFLQKMIEVMQQRRFHPVKTLAFGLAIGANPLFVYTVTQNLQGFLGIALFGLGAADMLRFLAGRDTQAGFRAGLLFMTTSLVQASGLLYVTVAALAAPLISLARRGERGARSSTILVVLFPTFSVIASLAFLELVFLHSASPLLTSRIDYDPARWAILPHLVTTLDGFLLLAPMVSGWALAFLVRRPGAALISTTLFAALVVGYVLGLIPTNAGGNVYLTMIVMGVAILPAASTTRASVLITTIALVQVVIAWAAAFNRPVVLDWMQALGTLWGGLR